MDEINKRDLLSTFKGNTRREVLQSIGIGLTGIGIGASGVAADPGSGRRDTYDERMVPGERELSKNIAVTNNTDENVVVNLRVRRQTPGAKNPVVLDREFSASYKTESDDGFPNIVHDTRSAKLGAPGQFIAEVQTDAGRTGEMNFSNAVGQIDRNKCISIRINQEAVKLSYKRS